MVKNMKKYLRFGIIPKCGKSIDFIKLSLDDNSDFSYLLGVGAIEDAYDCIPEKCFEKGVSVFELDEEGSPILDTEELINDYNFRIERGDVGMIVTGEEVGRGRSGEPLPTNIKQFNN